jgi:phage-related protein
MFYNGDIKFKGESSKAHPLIITTPPTVSHSELIAEEYQIPGRNGILYGANPYRGSATISVKFALVADEGFQEGVSKYATAYRSTRQWLQGTGQLIIGDTPDAFYEVQKVEIASDERLILRYGELEAVFTIYPYEFLTSGEDALESYAEVENPGDTASPLYKITGTGSGTLTVNGNQMAYTSAGELYIDTRRFIAYDDNGDNRNKYLNGDYEGLRLQHGTNEITITGGSLEVYPRWGYNL